MKRETLRLPRLDARQALLLRALLSPPDEAADVWARWFDPIRDSAWLEHLSPYKRIWPLILRSLARNGTPIDLEIRIVLKAALASEKLRHLRVWRRLRSCVERLSAAGVASIVQGGAALADTVYPGPGLRHVHGVRLGVSDVERALVELSKQGFLPRTGTNPTPSDSIALEGPDRQTLSLAFDRNARETPRRGSPLALQRPFDALASAWEETLAPRAPPLVWAFDVFFATELVRRAPSINRPAETDRLLNDAIGVLEEILSTADGPIVDLGRERRR